MKKFIFPLILGLFGLPALVLNSSCDKNDPVEAYFISGEDVGFSSVLLSNIIDVGLEVAAANGSSTQPPNPIIPAGAKIIIIDSTLTDNDPIEYIVEFPKIDTVVYSGGVICPDDRTRGGVIHVSQSTLFDDIGCKIILDLKDDSAAHHIGNGNRFAKYTGHLEITRQSAGAFNVSFTNGKAKYKSGTVLMTAEFAVSLAIDGGAGVFNDTYKYTGVGTGTNREGIALTWFIGQGLMHDVKPSCAHVFRAGLIEVNSGSKGKTNVKFDPKLTGICDNYFSVTLADGKSQDYKVN